MRFITAAIAFVALSTGALAQSIWTVPSASTPTLRFALESPGSPVQPGDTIQLTEAGFYQDTFTVTTPDLIIEAAPENDITIDALGLGSALTVGPFNGSLTLRNLTITGGLAVDGGAIRIEGTGNNLITIENCTIENNIATDDGGAIVSQDANIVISDSLFRNNETNGEHPSSPTNTSSNGGAITTRNGSIFIRDSVFESNTSFDEGGAIRCFDPASVLILSVDFRNNRSLSSSGGAIEISGAESASVAIEAATFENNQTGTSSDSFGGAARFVNCGNLSITDSTFLRNRAERGGAISFESESAGLLEDAVFQHNTAQRFGGALLLSNADIDTDRAQFLGNRAIQTAGGAVQLVEGPAGASSFRNSLFVGNVAQSASVMLATSVNTELSNCTAVMNNTLDPNGGTFVDFSGIGVQVINSIVRNNTPDSLIQDSTNQSAMYYSNISGLSGSLFDNFFTNNIDADPLFVRMPNDGGDGFGDDPTTQGIDESLNDDFGDLRLTEGSPSIDAADTRQVTSPFSGDLPAADPKDLLNNNRAVSINGYTGLPEDIGIPVMGQAADHGAYEVQTADPTLDFDMSGFLDSFDVLEFLDLFNAATSN